ncbi:MAG: HAMP domain-containing sensor histidine kinase [Lachnospiraceae bacterium]|nr:HAMP domain-containing sensor histidine kinase [Lachnospiraceae bacterium]
MLRKMRWRLIWSAMAVFSLVMTLLAGVILLGSYVIMRNRQDQVLEEIYKYEQRAGKPGDDRRFPEIDRPGRQQPEFEYTTRFFLVYCDPNGKAVHVSKDFISSVTETQAMEYAETLLQKEKKAGYYDHFRYRVFETERGMMVIFLNTDMETMFLGTLLLISVIVVAVGLLAAFPLILMLSKRAIRPYARNIEQQKRFITDAGHELKTPITSISTSIDVLEMLHGEDEWTENIRKQTARMTKLVANLITLSRLDEETPFPEKEEFSLSDAAWETAQPFAAIAEAKGRRYSQEIEEGIRYTGDRAAIQQMISILLDNAVRYSDEGGEILLHVYEKYGKRRIEVFNTCEIGDITEIDHLFERFYRPDASRSRNTGGSGIGLSIARATAEAHGGRITAESPDGKTIMFKIIL